MVTINLSYFLLKFGNVLPNTNQHIYIAYDAKCDFAKSLVKINGTIRFPSPYKHRPRHKSHPYKYFSSNVVKNALLQHGGCCVLNEEPVDQG